MLQWQTIAINLRSYMNGNRMDLCEETDAIAGDNNCLATGVCMGCIDAEAAQDMDASITALR